MSRTLTESLVIHVSLMRVHWALTSTRFMVRNSSHWTFSDTDFFTIDFLHTVHFTRWSTISVLSTIILGTLVTLTLGLVPLIHFHVESWLALSTPELKVTMRTRESSAVITVLAQLLVVSILSFGHCEAASHH